MNQATCPASPTHHALLDPAPGCGSNSKTGETPSHHCASRQYASDCHTPFSRICLRGTCYSVEKRLPNLLRLPSVQCVRGHSDDEDVAGVHPSHIPPVIIEDMLAVEAHEFTYEASIGIIRRTFFVDTTTESKERFAIRSRRSPVPAKPPREARFFDSRCRSRRRVSPDLYRRDVCPALPEGTAETEFGLLSLR